jgi:hypothetical protein
MIPMMSMRRSVVGAPRGRQVVPARVVAAFERVVGPLTHGKLRMAS